MESVGIINGCSILWFNREGKEVDDRYDKRSRKNHEGKIGVHSK